MINNRMKVNDDYVYLDYAATTPMDERVIQVIDKHFKETYGNSSSLHSAGQKAAQILENSRRRIASLINAERSEIFFTSSGTEADNLSLFGVSRKSKGLGNHIITTSIEHHAIENPCKYLEKSGYKVTYLPVSESGRINLEDLKDKITDKTILISIMTANNEIGTIQPIKEIGEIAHDHNIIFHTDAVQAFGKIPIDVEEMHIDLLSASSHKIYGPKGIGLIYMRNRGETETGEKFIEPIMYGGGHEKNMRPSTVAVPLIAGFAKAVELANEEMQTEAERQIKLRDRIISTIISEIDDCFLNGHPTHRLSNNVNVTIKYIDGESMVLDLDLEGIAVSTGSACSSKSLEPSHVLKAIGLSDQEAQGSLRITIGRFTTAKEIEYLFEKLPKIVKRLREMSPMKKDQ
ncbi:MAG: cysteine desulfurase family protein [Promethearchaeia archaeon]